MPNVEILRVNTVSGKFVCFSVSLRESQHNFVLLLICCLVVGGDLLFQIVHIFMCTWSTGTL